MSLNDGCYTENDLLGSELDTFFAGASFSGDLRLFEWSELLLRLVTLSILNSKGFVLTSSSPHYET